MSADLLRRAAALMRERAVVAAAPWHPWGDDSLPQEEGMPAWGAGMEGYLGGAWGVHAASWHPAVALAVADWLEQAAHLDLLGVDAGDWQQSLAVARAYLGETA